MPYAIVINLNALAGALAEEDPERAHALVRESRRLRASLGYETPAVVTNTVTTSALIGDWTQVLELASASVRYLHWTNDAPQLGGILNIVACALAPTDAEAAAVLQGAARRLAAAAIPTLDPTTPAPGTPRTRSDGARAASPGSAGFFAQLRRTTTGLLNNALGEARLRHLRAEGQAFDNDHAVAYALDAIERATSAMTDEREFSHDPSATGRYPERRP
jgi:hypothetical protein